MSPEKQRIAIAEACGWKRCRSPLQSKSDPAPRAWTRGGGGWKSVQNVPDYLNDLNAMRMAFKSLSLSAQVLFNDHLVVIIREACADNVDEKSLWMLSVNATAAQRAEAFLKTFNLWEA